jgi:hypothetical protein
LDVAVFFLLFTNASFSDTDPGGLMNYSHDLEHLSLSVVFGGIRVPQSFAFCVVYGKALFMRLFLFFGT